MLRGFRSPDDSTIYMKHYWKYIKTMNTVVHSLDNEFKARIWMRTQNNSEWNSISFTKNALGEYDYNNNEAAKREQRATLFDELMRALKRDEEVGKKSPWISIIELHETPTDESDAASCKRIFLSVRVRY
jgi:hypothetical protein